MAKCFTCGGSFGSTTVEILNRYKTHAENTGESFWFYTIQNSNNVQIATADDFSRFKKDNAKLFKAKKVEFANILEFRSTPDTEVLGDNQEQQ